MAQVRASTFNPRDYSDKAERLAAPFGVDDRVRGRRFGPERHDAVIDLTVSADVALRFNAKLSNLVQDHFGQDVLAPDTTDHPSKLTISGFHSLATGRREHAKERMQQRGVAAEQVKSVLDRPRSQERNPLENSVRLERDFEGRVLKVWVAEPWPPTYEAVIKSTAWHYCMTIKVPVKKKGLLIGKGGRTVQAIRASTGARVEVHEDGTVRISADDSQTVETARQRIVAIAVNSGRRHPGAWR